MLRSELGHDSRLARGRSPDGARPARLGPAPDHSFAAGALTGLVIAGALVHAWFAVLLAPLRETYAELADPASIPCLTKLMVHPAWLWGMPLVGAGLAVALVARRPRRLGPYVASVMLLACTLAATWLLTQTPARQLAERITTDSQVELVPVGP